MRLTFQQVINEKMKNPEFRREWEEQEPEFQLIRAMLQAREDLNISQRQLSEKPGSRRLISAKSKTAKGTQRYKL